MAFSSIAQNEIGHARALYELAAAELFDDGGRAGIRPQAGGVPLGTARRASPPGMGRTIARHWLYETADEIRLAALKASDDPEIAAIAAKMDREEAYHRMHAEMWIDRLLSTQDGRSRLNEAVDALALRASVCSTASSGPSSAAEPRSGWGATFRCRARPARSPRGRAAELLEEMTMVRRSAPPGTQW